MARLALLILSVLLSGCAATSSVAPRPPIEPDWNLTIFVRDPANRMISGATVHFGEGETHRVGTADALGRQRALVSGHVIVWAEAPGFFPSVRGYRASGEHIITLYPYARADE